MDAADSENDPSNKAVGLVERNVIPQGIPLIDPDSVAKVDGYDLMTLVAEIERADKCIKDNACNKLQVIATQIRFLQKQAQDILMEAQRHSKLHHVACNFVKQRGHIYHLYQRESGQLYFSMLSPEEWGNFSLSQNYKGAYRFEGDCSWTPISELEAKDENLQLLRKFLPPNMTKPILDINTQI
ncbi:hypothetical protein P5V15_008511 [Pogonomyrmex californicus]